MSRDRIRDLPQAESEAPARGVGRPRLCTERSAQIIDAFIELVGSVGLERVTLDDVARVAGVGRPAMRHFVGNREQLITATIVELVHRYMRTIRELAGKAPTAPELIDLLFSSEWTLGQNSEDVAFDSLLSEAMLNPHTRQSLKEAYGVLMDAIMSALNRTYPAAPPSRVRDAAYVIACLAEQNSTFQQIGYPRARSAAARALAVAAAERLAEN